MANSFRTKVYTLGLITAFTGGQRSQAQMATGVRTSSLTFKAAGTVTTAVHPLNSIMNGGKLRACFQYSGLNEGSDDVWRPDCRSIARQSDLYLGGPSSNIPLISLAAGAYALKDQWTIYACSPSAVRPWETAWVAKNQQTQTYAFVDVVPLLGSGPNWNVAGVLGAVAAGGTCVLTNLTVSIEQEFDEQINIQSYFRPRYRTVAFAQPAGVTADTPFVLNQTLPVRSILLAQDSNVGTVPDSLTGVRLIYDKGQIIGTQGVVPWDDLVQSMDKRYGGAIDASAIVAAAIAAVQPTSYIDPFAVFFDFQRISSGNLSLILRPELIGPNLRFTLNTQGSAVTGWTQTNAMATICEMEEVPGLTNPEHPWNAKRGK